MGWTNEQQKRLNKETEVLRQYFTDFKIKYLDLQICFEGWMTTNLNNKYFLRLYVPHDMPNSVPEVVILYPENLIDYNGKRVVDLHQNQSMHLLFPKSGYPNICTYKPTHWHPGITFYNVLVKARIWLEAFDGHRITGKPLDHYLKHQL